MANFLPMPPYDELSRHIKYDPDTGVGIWLVSLSNRAQVGTIAGASNNQYWHIQYKNKCYKAHRLFWFLQTGQDPGPLTIDHIDQDKLNNKFSNLRLATYNEQEQNKGKRLDNTSGHRGVFWKKDIKKYHARIKNYGKTIHLGYYNTLTEAVAARQAKELELYNFSPLHQLNNDERLILDDNDQQLSLLRHPSF
jgi:hypothetical protein